MKDLFMCLILNLSKLGKMTEAVMYDGGEFSQVKIETESGKYTISVSKEEVKKNA